MARATAKVAEQMYDLSDLKESERTTNAVFQGVCSIMNWKQGKKVTLKEYQQAVNTFLDGSGGDKYAKGC